VRVVATTGGTASATQRLRAGFGRREAKSGQLTCKPPGPRGGAPGVQSLRLPLAAPANAGHRPLRGPRSLVQPSDRGCSRLKACRGCLRQPRTQIRRRLTGRHRRQGSAQRRSLPHVDLDDLGSGRGERLDLLHRGVSLAPVSHRQAVKAVLGRRRGGSGAPPGRGAHGFISYASLRAKTCSFQTRS
jgi:hypothetical protein